MPFSLAELNDLLAARRFDGLVGKVENEWFDAKDQPYDVDSDRGKRELAKDVAAFANSGGGLIVIGLRTSKSIVHFGDEVVKVRPVEQNRIDSGRYRNILADWVFPAVEGVEIEWLATQEDAGRGLFAIRIPPQAEELRPFLVVKTVDTGKIVETFFGYAERRGDANSPIGVVDLQRTLHTGLNFERRLDGRLSAIEATLLNPPTNNKEQEGEQEWREMVRGRMAGAVAASDFADDRAFVLAARPAAGNELQTIFSSADDSIRRKVERPTAFRDNGWDLQTSGYAQIIRGEMIRVAGFRKVVDLYRDGTLVFACAAHEDFLAWTSKVQQIHPMAVVEICYNFAVLYEVVLLDLKRPTTEVEFVVGLRHLHQGGVKTKLGAFGYGTIGQLMPDYIRQAPDDEVTITTTVAVKDYVAGRVAFQVAREIYLWFGLDEDKIPYTNTADGHRYIDANLLGRA